MPRADPIRVWYFLRGGSALGDTLVWTLAPVYFAQTVGMSPLQLVLVGTCMELAIGAVGNAFGIRAALALGASLLSPAVALNARALRRPELPQPVQAGT